MFKRAGMSVRLSDVGMKRFTDRSERRAMMSLALAVVGFAHGCRTNRGRTRLSWDASACRLGDTQARDARGYRRLPSSTNSRTGRSKMVSGKYTRISDADRAALSPLRQKAVKLLEDNVPVQGLTSDAPEFARLTGYSTATLKEKWKSMPTFTTCNAFGGNYAILLGAPPGCWLTRGLLQLDWVKKDVPAAEPIGSALPPV